MYKRFIFVAGLVFTLSGCSLPSISSLSGTSGGGDAFMRSSDGGANFTSKVTIDEKTNFANADILAFAYDKKNTSVLWLGTRENGILKTEDNGDHWKKIDYPPTKVYGLVVDADNSNRLFATGEYQERGKIFKTEDGGENWDEVYTEPAGGTVIISLAQNPFNPQVLYAGTSAGVVIKTTDGGLTWKNLPLTIDGKSVNQPVTNIFCDTLRDGLTYFVVKSKGLIVLDNDKFVSQTETAGTNGITNNLPKQTTPEIASIAFDPNRSGVIYIGSTKGLFKSSDFGATWQSIDILESSKKYPVRAVAINPFNSNEIMYGSALALYKSVDGGNHWMTHQLQGGRPTSLIWYDPQNTDVIYLGFKAQ